MTGRRQRFNKVQAKKLNDIRYQKILFFLWRCVKVITVVERWVTGGLWTT